MLTLACSEKYLQVLDWCTIFIWSPRSCKLFLWDNEKSHLRWMLWDTVTESLEKEILAKCSTDSLRQTFHWEFLGEKSSQSSQLQMEQDIRFFSDACNLWRDYNRPWKGGFIAEQSVWTKCTSDLSSFNSHCILNSGGKEYFLIIDLLKRKHMQHSAVIKHLTSFLLVSGDPNIKRFSRLRPMIWFCQSIFSEKTEYNILQVWLLQPVTFMVMRNTWLLWC